MRKTTFFTAAGAMAWLAACVATLPVAGPAAASAELRVMVKLNQPSEDIQSIAARVTAAAGTNARYLAASSPEWHALALVCADVLSCDAAFQRLSANKAAFQVVQRDERKRLVTP